MQLILTAELIRAYLFNGGFRAMTKTDHQTYGGAEEGSLIADIKIGRYTYGVIFSPAIGDVDINTFDEATDQFYSWKMDLNNGNVIRLA